MEPGFCKRWEFGGEIQIDETMNARYYAALFLANVVFIMGIAIMQSTPGYMDADYYYASGLRIANSGSWSEPFIWNYLGDPQGLPHPAFSYWMPLAEALSFKNLIIFKHISSIQKRVISNG